jgi:metal-responsive CopG/Arc/MetJ family transcriptional regulator
MKKLKENEKTMVISLCIPVSLNKKLEDLASKSNKYNNKSKVIRHWIESKVDELENMKWGDDHGR